MGMLGYILMIVVGGPVVRFLMTPTLWLVGFALHLIP